jgi:hypothetical protein
MIGDIFYMRIDDFAMCSIPTSHIPLEISTNVPGRYSKPQQRV